MNTDLTRNYFYLCLCLCLLNFLPLADFSFAQQTQTQTQPQTQTQTRPGAPAPTHKLRVSSLPDLRGPLTEMGKFFEKFHPAYSVDLDFDSPDLLNSEIETGAPIDVFISSNEKDLDEFRAKKLVSGITKLVSDEVVIIARADTTLDIKEPKNLVNDNVKQVALVSGTRGFAKACRDYLTKVGVMQSLTGKILEVKSQKEAMEKLKAGQAQWAFSYTSKSADNSAIKIIWHVPENDIAADAYYSAIPAASKQPQVARQFVDALHSTIASMLFKNQGYIIPQTQTQTAPSKRQPQTQTQPIRQHHKKKNPKHQKSKHKQSPNSKNQ